MSKKPKIRLLLLLMAAFALVASACTDTVDDRTSPPTTGENGSEPNNPGESVGEGETTEIALQRNLSCSAILDQLQNSAEEQFKFFDLAEGSFDDEEAMEDAETTTESAESTREASATTADEGDVDGVDDFESNNQESGVDELDIVKSDGNVIVTVEGNNGSPTVRVVDTNLENQETFRFADQNFWPQGVFFNEGKILVMGSTWGTSNRIDTFWGESSAGVIYELDMEERKASKVVEVPGAYIRTARSIDGVVRIITEYYPESYFWRNGDFEQTIENMELEHWTGSIVVDGESFIPNCEDIYVPNVNPYQGVTSVLTLADNNGYEVVDYTTVFGNPSQVYASLNYLVVASNDWSGVQSTIFNVFDISGEEAVYVGSNSVDGYLGWGAGQFTMNERNDVLRVVLTGLQAEDTDWKQDEDIIIGSDSTHGSRIYTLDLTDENLPVLGESGVIGENEEVQSVRFLGDLAYVVTFRQTDPFYIVDLSDPTDPTVRGELKIPGFSAYLHNIEEGFVLGVGQDGTDDGRLIGLQASKFDVRDLDNPTRISTFEYGPNTYSPVEWDHLAFRWLAGDEVAFIPVSQWNESGQQTNYVSVVSTSGDLEEIGQLVPNLNDCNIEEPQTSTFFEDDAEAELTTEPAPLPGFSECYYNNWLNEVQRTLMINDDVFVISQGGITKFEDINDSGIGLRWD